MESYGTLRSQLYNKHGNFFKKDAANSKRFYETYPTEKSWVDINFKDANSAAILKSKVVKIGIEPAIGDDEFIKKYACDQEWAKSLEYCKVAPEQRKAGFYIVKDDKILTAEKSKFPTCIQQYPLYLEVDDQGAEKYMIYFSVGEGDARLQARYYVNGYVYQKEGNKPGEMKTYKCETADTQGQKDSFPNTTTA